MSLSIRLDGAQRTSGYIVVDPFNEQPNAIRFSHHRDISPVPHIPQEVVGLRDIYD